MFDLVHENKKLIQVVLAVIVLPFALWGVSSYDRSRNSIESVASVNGINISQQEFENTLRQQQERMRQQLGAKFDAKMFDNPGMKRAVLDNMISRDLQILSAQTAGLAVTDEQVAKVIAAIEAFQEGGKFDKKRYEAALANQNMTPLMFEKRVRDELLVQQIQDVYAQNGYFSKNIAENVIRLNEQQRMVSTSAVSFQSYIPLAKVSDTELKKYYDENPNEYQVQEQAKVEYVKFSIDDLLAKTELNKDDIRKYYDEHQNEFGSPEERKAAHILIAVNANASQSEKDGAKDKAEKILQQARENPAKFDELARKYSQDPGSAQNGGDIGFFGRGMMDKSFEDAAFELKQGEISDVVTSDFGYHIIKLLAIKPSRILPFDEAREGIANKLRQRKAADMFAEMAEKFSNTVYEQSDTLKPAAELVGEKIERTDWLVKGSSAGEPWTAKMLDAIFNDEVVKNKRNTAAIEVNTNILVAARILEYKPASVRSFSEVQESVRQKLLRQRAQELVIKQGKSILEQLQAGKKPALKWGDLQAVTRVKHGTLDSGLIRQVFQADYAKLPQFVGSEMLQGGYLLVRIDTVKEGEAITDEKLARYSQQLRQLTGEEISRAFMDNAKRQATIKVNLSENVSGQP